MEFRAAKGDKSPYICGECGEPIIPIREGELYRPCGHMEASVLANMEAIVYGESAVQ